MRTQDLKSLLDGVPDTRELILRRSTRAPAVDVAYEVWRDAHEEAARAYAAWRPGVGPEAYAAYRAAQDREDAAQDLLARGGGG